MLGTSVPRPVMVIVSKVEVGVSCDGFPAAPADGLACSDYGLPVLAEPSVVVSVPALGGGSLLGHQLITVAIAAQLAEPVAVIVAFSRAAFMYKYTSDPPGLSK